MREKEYGIWQALSWADLATLVEHLHGPVKVRARAE